jgi:hypothetical protein
MHRLFRQLTFKKTEHFLKEGALAGGVDVNTQVSNTTNYSSSNESNTNVQKILNSQDLMKSISSAYDKTVEVLNKTSKEVEKEAKAVNESLTKQSNVINLKGANLKGTKMTLEQSNKLTKTVALSASLQFINEIDADQKTKAIVADMLGVTQGTEAIQNTIQNAAQEAANMQASKQESTQDAKTSFSFRENFLSGRLKERVCIIGCVNVNTQVTNQDNTQVSELHNYSDNLTDNSIKSQEIQNYVSTLTDKTQNVTETKEKISQTIQNVADTVQENLIDMEGVNAEDVELSFKQVNELEETITNGFSDYMEEVTKVVSDTSLEATQEITADQTEVAIQSNDQTVSQGLTSEQTSDQTTTQTAATGTNSVIMLIVICIVAVVALGAGVKIYFSMKKKKDKKKKEGAAGEEIQK